MKVLLIFAYIAGSVLAEKECHPRYHYWRPFNGSIPNDAFVAGLDKDNVKSYVVKIIPLDQYLWTVPAQLKEGADHVDFEWCCNDGKVARKVLRVDEFIEILCTEDPDNLSWEKVQAYASEIESRCCFVQGGIALFGNHIYRPYIGRAKEDGFNFVGRAYSEKSWNGLHIMDGSNATKIYENFELLTYDCQKEAEVA